MSEINSETVGGSCLCGICSFTVPASSVRFGFASCHCSACRLSHAAPFVQWSGMNADKSNDFILPMETSNLTAFRSSTNCTRYFCKSCGTHLYIKYDDEAAGNWAGEIHFPTAILDVSSLANLEKVMQATGKPRYLHVFASDRLPCLGDLKEWAAAPQYGGKTGLEPMPASSSVSNEVEENNISVEAVVIGNDSVFITVIEIPKSRLIKVSLCRTSKKM